MHLVSTVGSASTLHLVSTDTSVEGLFDFVQTKRFLFAAAGDDGSRSSIAPSERVSRLVATMPTDDFVGSVEQNPGNLLLVGTRTEGLRVVDLSNPVGPVEVGRSEVPRWNTLDGLTSIAVSGDLVFLAKGLEGLDIVSLADPTSPEKIEEYRDRANQVMTHTDVPQGIPGAMCP